MIFGLLRMIGPPPKMGKPASEIKPTPVHGSVAAAIIVISVIVIGVMMVNGLSIVLTTACIIGFSALILGSLFVGGVQKYRQAGQALKICRCRAPRLRRYRCERELTSLLR